MANKAIENILKSFFFFGLLSIVPKLISLSKDSLVAFYLGANEQLDMYLLSLSFIALPISVIVSTLQSNMIPALVARDKLEASILFGSIMKFTFLSLIVVMPLWYFFFPSVYVALFPSASPSNIRDMSECMNYLIPYFILSAFNLLFYGVLQAKNKFWPTAVFPATISLTILALLLIERRGSLELLLKGTVIGSLAESFILIYLLREYRFCLNHRMRHSDLKSVVFLSIPLALGGTVSFLVPLVEQIIGFSVKPSAISLLYYGNKIPATLCSVLITGIGITTLSYLSAIAADQNWNLYKKTFYKTSTIVFMIACIVVSFGFFFAADVIQLFYQRGEFSPEDALIASNIMKIYLIQLPFQMVAIVSIRALIVLQKTVQISLICIAQAIIMAMLSYLFSTYLGIEGVALGSVAAIVLGSCILFIQTLQSLDQADSIFS